MTFHSLFELFLSWFKPKALETLPPTPVSTTIKIYIGDQVVGAIQSISIEELNNNNATSAAPNKITANRIRFDRARIAEAFSRGFVHKASQKIPFQIEIEDKEVVTTIQNAWIDEDVGYSYVTNDWTIIDCMKLVAEKIFSKKKKKK